MKGTASLNHSGKLVSRRVYDKGICEHTTFGAIRRLFSQWVAVAKLISSGANYYVMLFEKP